MIDPVLSLAVSMHSNRGVYALLLGSGVSRSSGVPTGWEIVQDLIRRLAHLKGESCEPDPAEWYQTTFESAPHYSTILDEVAKSSAERMQLLRGYFEPTEEEREEGRKLPTPSHRAIASLVARGYIRVIVTTNFDRLLELALADVAVQPFVVSTADMASGALPLAHSPCTVIKVNGDYLDSRLKNTNDELWRYEESIEKLLGQVFDEYGLLVCGWSGEWDTALRAAIERCPTRRFTTYWATMSPLKESAQTLATHRRATILSIPSADQFFGDLSEQVLALESFSNTDVLSTKVAVARMKRYLADPSQRINLHDLLVTETERVHAKLAAPPFSILNSGVSVGEIQSRARGYELAIEGVLSLFVCGAHWAEPQHDTILLKCFKRLTDISGSQNGYDHWTKLQSYPGLVLLYAMSLAAVSAGNYRFLRSLFSLKIRLGHNRPEKTVAASLYDQAAMTRQLQQEVYGNRHTPMSDHLFQHLRDPLREYIASDSEYDGAFDWFEYLLCLCHCDASSSRDSLAAMKASSPDFTLWASVGRFGWKNSFDDSPAIDQETELKTGELMPAKVAAVIRAGFFDSAGHSEDKFREVKAAFDRLLSRVRANWLW